MASGTGMAGLAVTAVVSALVAFGVSLVFGPALAPPPGAAPGSPGAAGTAGAPGSPESTESLRREVERLRREVQELRGRATGTASPAAPAASASPDPDDPAHRAIPATREELRAFVDARITERFASVPGGPGSGQARTRKTLDEAGAELGLSSVDLDSVKRVWKDSETEGVTLLMGTTDMDAIREEVRLAKDDPDRKAALINRVVGNMVRNLGRVATIKDRRDRELRKFLSEDQVGKLKAMDIRSTSEDEGMDEIFKGTFGD